jgi:5-methylcytosine-specific restriction endonuclease McrA
MSRRPEHLGKRKDFSAHTKKLARERADYVCEYPGCDASAHEVDHIVPQGLGGKSSLCNAQLLCGTHHKQKTAQDVKVMAKADRMGGRSGQYKRRKNNGSKIQSRGFQKPPEGFKHSWPGQSLNRRQKTS